MNDLNKQWQKLKLNSEFGLLSAGPAIVKRSYYDQNLCEEIMLDAETVLNQILELKIGFANHVTDGINERKKVKQYKFSRAKWYEVDIMFKSYEAKQERLEWCQENFGDHPVVFDAWSRWCKIGLSRIRFRDSEDYEWFMLRWS